MEQFSFLIIFFYILALLRRLLSKIQLMPLNSQRAFVSRHTESTSTGISRLWSMPLKNGLFRSTSTLK